MLMKTRTWLKMPLFLAPWLLSCAPEPQGQIVLALQTDVSLPKDIDRVRIEVTYTDNGAIAYQRDFDKLGSTEGIRLPATLGFLAPKSTDRAIRVRVIASRGSAEGVRLLREVVTTVPQTRTALLSVPIEFLCDGSAQAERDEFGKVKRDDSGNVVVKSTCPNGFTCKAGKCAESTAPAESLPDYDDGKVFGGGSGNGDGTCFDTTTCFDAATDIALNLENEKCMGTLSQGSVAGVNIGLRTQGGGICGAKGCFVALDFDSDAGWKALSANTIELPVNVCERVATRTIAGVVAADVRGAPCEQKRASIPTCGPWSASGEKYQPPVNENAPVYIATGQVNPVALALTQNAIYWTSKGSLAADGSSNGKGAVKMVPKLGGEPFVIAENQDAPSGLVLDVDRHFVLWTNEQGTSGGSVRWAPFAQDANVSPSANVLIDGLLQPAGMALENKKDVYFTEVGRNQVHRVTTNVDNDALIADVNTQLWEAPDPLAISPRSIAAANGTVCVAYEGKLNAGNGFVACLDGVSSQVIKDQQATPRAIALASDGKTVYWANFASTGPNGVMRAAVSGGTAEEAAQVPAPAGLAIDQEKQRLYITSHSDRKIYWVPLDGSAGAQAIVDSRPQPGSPGAIALDDEYLYWVEDGSGANNAYGAILKIKKP